MPGEGQPQKEQSRKNARSFTPRPGTLRPPLDTAGLNGRLLCAALRPVPRERVFSKVVICTRRMAPAVLPDPSDTVLLRPGK